MTLRPKKPRQAAELVVDPSDIAVVEGMLGFSPRIVGYHLRDMLAHMAAKTSKETFIRAPRGLKPGKKRGWAPFVASPFRGVDNARELRARFKRSPVRDLSLFSAVVLVRNPVALAHERGALIRPKNKRALLVPIDKRLKKRSAKSRTRLAARIVGDTFIVQRKRGGTRVAFVAGESRSKKTAKGKPKLVLLFALRPSVRIRARLGLRKTHASLAPWRRALAASTQERILAELVGKTPRDQRRATERKEMLQQIERDLRVVAKNPGAPIAGVL